ncbi:ubiquitin carboxyl-terminal hydrolase 16-like [Canna indica]|uniref:ubiquitinyl hydrolase 1 n=1 Tax=Canna indica TaxID=4628 RepID=A0AAQ3JW63_9LILI|nr:ubiquitin carboxyl-terminal hydrolase 16-like [Canna indica]
MRVYGDLGFSAAAALAFLFFGPVIVFVVRRRWRLAAARQAEVRRLALLAAREAAQAEMEAMAVYAAASAAAVAATSVAVEKEYSSRLECPVCFNPATARCGRCKAVRYCSGKCQIIHWRQGHKDECHPPPVSDNYNGEFSSSGLKGVESEQSDLTKGLEHKEDLTNAVETFPERPVASESARSPNANNDGYEHEEISSEDVAGKDSAFGSLSAESISSQSTVSNGISYMDNAPSTNNPLPQQNGGLGELSSFATPAATTGTKSTTTSNANSTTLSTSELARFNSVANNTSCSSDIKDKASTSKIETDDSILSGPSCLKPSSSLDHASKADECQINAPQRIGNGIHPSTLSTSEDSSHASALSGTKSQSEQNGTLPSEKKTLLANGTSSENSLKSRTVRSSASVGQFSTIGGAQLGRSHKSSMSGTAQRGPSASSYTSGSVSNGFSTSDKRVVKELASSKISRHYSSELMLFPYDRFIKLYNSNNIELRPCGLINCGNSCYANAVLQCLTFTRPLTAYLLGGLHSKICPKKEWCFTCELENIVSNAKQGGSPLSPIGILSHLQNIGSNFAQGQEEDAHEFLRYAIEAMQSVCLKEAGAKPNGVLAEETTLIQQTFGGYLRSKIRCCRCKGKSERCERMMDLTVEIDGEISTLDEALLRFTSLEILDGENKYECIRCKSYERAKKRLTILEAPNVLTIVLKRFQSGKFGKLNKAIRFPEYLNLAPCMSGDDKSPVYRLYAVIVHIDVMNASFSGHYVCYVKDTQGKWYKINDAKVKPVSLEKVLSKSAYMLLYSRCSPRAPSSIRKAISHELVQARKIRKPGGSSVAHLANLIDDHSNFHLPDLVNGRLRLPLNDYLSDNSSLFDEGSSSISTESTRDSTSTEDSWEQDSINLNSPLRVFEDSDGFIHSPVGSRHSSGAVLNGSVTDPTRSNDSGSYPSSSGREIDRVEVQRISSFLFSEKSGNCRHITEQSRTRTVDWIPNEGKSGVLLRRPSSERSAQTFY